MVRPPSEPRSTTTPSRGRNTKGMQGLLDPQSTGTPPCRHVCRDRSRRCRHPGSLRDRRRAIGRGRAPTQVPGHHRQRHGQGAGTSDRSLDTAARPPEASSEGQSLISVMCSLQTARRLKRCRSSSCTSQPMEPDEMRRRATRYRDLARMVTDPAAIKALRELAEEYEARADAAQVHVHPRREVEEGQKD